LSAASALAPSDLKVAQLLSDVRAAILQERENDRRLFQSLSQKNNTVSTFGYRPPLLSEPPETLRSICNFRDVGGLRSSDGMFAVRRRFLYRSSNLTDGVKDDLDCLVQIFGVKTVVDLRNGSEVKAYIPHAKKHAGDKFFDYREVFIPVRADVDPGTGMWSLSVPRSGAALFRRKREATAPEMRPWLQRLLPAMPATREEREEILKGRIAISVDAGTRTVLSLVPWWMWIVVFLMGALFMIKQASNIVVKNTCQRIGPLELYKRMIRLQGPEIRCVFELLSNPQNYPIVLSCSLGKDRTGVVVALVMLGLGVRESDIIEDYARSTNQLTPELKRLNRRLGLGPEWSIANPKDMEELLRHIRDDWGGIDKYLESIRVDSGVVDRVRRILLKPKKE
jgi:protein tyrosine/serine phosphatase